MNIEFEHVAVALVLCIDIQNVGVALVSDMLTMKWHGFRAHSDLKMLLWNWFPACQL